MPKPKKPRKRRQPKTQAVQPVAPSIAFISTVNVFPSLTDLERHHFQHFLQWTTTQLSVSPASTNFWLRYALPMAHNSEPIRYSMIAVGASHRLFMAQSVGHSHPWELKRFAIRQYNKAIASILPTMGARSTSNMHCILVCCLLFVSFESLTGRYSELFKHLRAGNELFHAPLHTSTPEERAVTEKLVEMFCRLGVESSSFMDEHCLSGVSQWYCDNSTTSTISCLPFKNLDEASYELRQLDLRPTDKPWDTDREIELADGREQEGASSLDLGDAFRRWNLRFEALARRQEVYLVTKAGPQLRNLRLRQQFWQVTINSFSSQEALSNPQTFAPLMAVAESVAAPFIAMNQPTFSLDGDLIFSLSFVASIAQDDGIKSQALDLLRKLNRREGIWDSHDVVEMHELMLSVNKCGGGPEESDGCCESEAPAGIPGIIRHLRTRLGKRTKASPLL
ncbi:hypothetical protein B0J13DRAFT_506637 [Dactylonectria estremocensis]|uniref:Uncharacterized protein n=1 Tax=Dactylonectria estremocensis TaxID=1079267 RepID=A0A9P9EG87_9HYPO|nr:hypothetical protein B0J13DRAFT_506637 [Dactylonectria estremocensis]